MNINTTIVDAYLNAEDVCKFSSMWLYVDRTEQGVENIFQAPPELEAKREIVSRIKDIKGLRL